MGGKTPDGVSSVRVERLSERDISDGADLRWPLLCHNGVRRERSDATRNHRKFDAFAHIGSRGIIVLSGCSIVETALGSWFFVQCDDVLASVLTSEVHPERALRLGIHGEVAPAQHLPQMRHPQPRRDHRPLRTRGPGACLMRESSGTGTPALNFSRNSPTKRLPQSC